MATSGPTAAQHRRMHVLWRYAGVTDRADRLALTGVAVGRRITSSLQLTQREAEALIRYMQQLDDAGELYARAQGWLARLGDHHGKATA